ncbi:MAG: hypothetical protein NC293_10130 [Roseburia sp.]|nr:hypothetical protein [Roseburia sp.]
MGSTMIGFIPPKKTGNNTGKGKKKTGDGKEKLVAPAQPDNESTDEAEGGALPEDDPGK